jgi:hypothetical protein
MRCLIPILLVVFAFSSYANASEKLKYESAVQNTEESNVASNLVRAAIFTHSNRYYQQGKIKSQRKARNYMIKTAAKNHTQEAQNPLNCFNSLAPDFCWYTGSAESDKAQPVVDLAFEYFKNSAPGSEEVCTTVNQPCDNIYNQDITHINLAVGEKPARPKKTVSAGSQVKLDFFSISLIF